MTHCIISIHTNNNKVLEHISFHIFKYDSHFKTFPSLSDLIRLHEYLVNVRVTSFSTPAFKGKCPGPY